MANEKLIAELVETLDQLFGLHPGFRPVHAKGVMAWGTFTPSKAALDLTRAPHLSRLSTLVLVRVSDFAGIPTVADNDPKLAAPRGFAIRFYLADHVHTDIVAHSHDGFPVRTGEDFVAFARAVMASAAATSKPTPIEQYLAAHPETVPFVSTPHPVPTSFARELFFGVNAMRFTNQAGKSRFGRYRVRPVEGGQYLSDDEAAKKSPNFLQEEFAHRLEKNSIQFQIRVQLANPNDVVNNATITWPNDRTEMDFGTVELTKIANASDPELRKIIFDPIPRVDGIDPSDDPLIQVRADLYLATGRRRRAVKA